MIDGGAAAITRTVGVLVIRKDGIVDGSFVTVIGGGGW